MAVSLVTAVSKGMEMQGVFQKVVPNDEAEAWIEDRKQFVISSLGSNSEDAKHRKFQFMNAIITDCDDEEIPEGSVLAILNFSAD